MEVSYENKETQTDLMKKGLRPVAQMRQHPVCRNTDRPDEEGIKTIDMSIFLDQFGNTDRPDEEGIKTLQSRV